MSSTEQNKTVIRTFFDRMNRGDVPGAFALLSENCTWFSLSQRKDVPREQMRAAITWVNESVMQGPIVQTVTVLTAEEDRVAALTEGHAVTLDGRTYDNAYHFLFQLNDGLITRLWEFNDTHLGWKIFPRSEGGALDLR